MNTCPHCISCNLCGYNGSCHDFSDRYRVSMNKMRLLNARYESKWVQDYFTFSSVNEIIAALSNMTEEQFELFKLTLILGK